MPKILSVKNIAIIIFILLFGGLLYLQSYYFKTATIPLSEQKISPNMGLIGVRSLDTEKPSLSIYRLHDAKSEIFQGNWQMHYMTEKEMVIYGTDSNNPEHQQFIVLGTGRGSIKDISKLPGPITAVAGNKESSYLLLMGLKNDSKSTTTPKTYVCVTPKNILSYDNCLSVTDTIIPAKIHDTSTPYQAYWNNAKDTELIITEVAGKQRSWTYDALRGRLNLIDAKNITDIPEPSLISTGMNKLYGLQRWGSLAMITELKTKKKFFFRIPPTSAIIPLADNYALIETENTAYILNFNTRTMSEFTTLPPSGKRQIITYYSYY